MSVEGPIEVDDSSPARSAEDHLRLIFNLCDQDKDGFITAQDFRSLGNEHFGNSQVREKERGGGGGGGEGGGKEGERGRGSNRTHL